MATPSFDLQRFKDEQRRRSRELYAGLFLATGMLVGLVGFIGDSRPEPCAPASADHLQQLLDAAHCTLQLITLNVSAEATQGWMLTLARWWVPGATLLLAFLAIVDRLPQWWVRTIVRRSSPKVLVLGCGKVGLRLAKFYAHALLPDGSVRRELIGIDQDLENPHTAEFKSSGFTLLEAPLTVPETLERLALDECKRIVVCTGDDAADLAIAKRAHARAPNAKVLISVENEGAHRACRLDPVLVGAYKQGNIQFFNAGHIEARLLLLKWAPHHVWPDRYRVGSMNSCHVAIYADGTFVAELAAQAVRALVYTPDEKSPLRITIFTNEPEAAERHLFGKHPILRKVVADEARHQAFGGQLPLADIRFARSHSLHLDATAVIDAHGKQRIDVMYVHGESPMLTRVMIAEAVKVCDVLAGERPAVVGCLHERDEYTVDALQGLPSLLFFRMGAWFLTPRADLDGTPDDLLDSAAITLKSAYDSAVASQGATLSAAEHRVRQLTQGEIAAWKRMPHAEHWMNRHGADHALLKLALLGIHVPLPQSPAQLEARLGDGDCREWLSRLEHRRYVCERMVDGWLRRGSDNSVNDYHLNPTLVPFDQLEESYQHYDRYFVDALPVVLGHALARPVRTIALAGHNAIDLNEAALIREGVARALTEIAKHPLAPDSSVRNEHWRLISPLAPGSDYVLTQAALLWLLEHSDCREGPASYSLDVCQASDVPTLVMKWAEHVGLAAGTPDGFLLGTKVTQARVQSMLREAHGRASLVLPIAAPSVTFQTVLATNDSYMLEHADELIVAVSGKRLGLGRLAASAFTTLTVPRSKEAGTLALGQRWLQQPAKTKRRLDSLHVVDIG